MQVYVLRIADCITCFKSSFFDLILLWLLTCELVLYFRVHGSSCIVNRRWTSTLETTRSERNAGVTPVEHTAMKRKTTAESPSITAGDGGGRGAYRAMAIALAALMIALCRPPGAGCEATALPPVHMHHNIAILPSDVYPGFGIKRFIGENKYTYFRLLDTDYSQYFAVLNDGLLMTTTDLGALVKRPVDLVVLEESPNTTVTHTMRLFVLEKREMLRFADDEYPDGRVSENRAPGARVKGVPVLHAFGEGVAGLPVRYAIVDGNDDGAFTLKAAENIAGNITNRSYYRGVHLVTKRPLDREQKPSYDLIVQAADGSSIDKAYARVHVDVADENDNSPVFDQTVYKINVDALGLGLRTGLLTGRVDNGSSAAVGYPSVAASASTVGGYSAVGRVHATDADGDHVAYRLTAPSSAVVVVPQTGELLVSDDALRSREFFECQLTVEAHDLRTPSRVSARPARVLIQYDYVVLDDDVLMQDLNAFDDVAAVHAEHRVYKRRVTRAVRPTKRIEFTETDGEQEGRSVFPLEKETEKETFKIRDENPWVTVEPNGAVRVKKKWDYEELGPEKTIDFWVTITNAGVGGKCWSLFFFVFFALIAFFSEFPNVRLLNRIMYCITLCGDILLVCCNI